MKLYTIIFSLILIYTNLSFALTRTDILPGFTLTAVSDNQLENPSADKRLFYFWATWCSTCEEKLKKVLPQLQKKHTNISLVTINLDNELERTQYFVKKNQISLPVFFDPNDQVRKTLKISAVPFWALYKKAVSGNWELVQSQPTFNLEKVEAAILK